MQRIELISAILFLAACGGPNPTEDAGARDSGASVDAPSAVQCEQQADCDDSLFCTEHRCEPGEPGADARGCVLEDGPCDAGETCVEADGMCVTGACTGDPDRDDDGRDSMACGGNDCDDDDPDRYPRAAGEVCDAAGHDEDCVDSTIAGATDGDVDADGYTSALCCFGATCGPDCDDADPATSPDARELCNGRDDDCDGSTDEAGTEPLCPGGVCTAGRCDLAEWSRTFGGTEEDAANAIAMDDVGNAYVAGYFAGSAAFGSATGRESSVLGTDGIPSVDMFIASYAADGRYRWVRTFGSPAADLAFDVAFDPVSGLVFATGIATGPVDLGGGARTGGVLLALDTDGTYQWDREIVTGTVFMSVDAHDGAVVSGAFRGTRTFGGATHTAIATEELFVTRFSAAGTHQWDYVSRGAPLARINPGRVALDASGGVTIAGWFSAASADFGASVHTNAGDDDAFAIALRPDGTLLWEYVAGGTGKDRALSMRVDPIGRVFLVGSFEGTVDFGGRVVTAPAPESAFLVALDSAGALDRVATWGGGSENVATSVAFTSTGDVLVAGAYSGSLNFGGGLTTAPPSGAAYLVTFDSSLNHLNDQTFTYPGFPGAACSAVGGCSSEARSLVVGPADSTALAGAFSGVVDLGRDVRTSEGDLDGFVLRLPN